MADGRSEVMAGDLAPDIELNDELARTVRLAAYWQARPVVFVFARHFG